MARPSSFISNTGGHLHLLLPLLVVVLPLLGLPQRAWAVPVTVSLDYSTYVGTAQTGGTGVTQWLGLRYAAPPLGDLRFARPQDPPVVNTTQPANAVSGYIYPRGARDTGRNMTLGRQTKDVDSLGTYMTITD